MMMMMTGLDLSMRFIDLEDKSVGDRDHLALSQHVKMLRCGPFRTDLSVSLIDF